MMVPPQLFMEPRMPVRAYLYPFLAMLLWAGNVVVSKLAASSIAPTAITFYRLVLVLLVMTPFIARPLWRNRATLRRQWWQLALCGVMSMALFQSLSYRAAESTTATNMAIVTALAPLMTALLSVLLLGERLTLGMAAGGVLSFGGLLYLVGRGDMLALLQQGVHAGDALMLLACLSFALYGVLLPPGSARLDATTLPLIGYAGIGSSIVLSYLWIEGVKLLGPNRCSIYVNLLPLLTALLAIVWLHESMHIYHLVGGGISLLGVLLAQTVQRPLFGRYRPGVSGTA